MANLQSNPMEERDMQEVVSEEEDDQYGVGGHRRSQSNPGSARSRPQPPTSLAIMPGKSLMGHSVNWLFHKECFHLQGRPFCELNWSILSDTLSHLTHLEQHSTLQLKYCSVSP